MATKHTTNVMGDKNAPLKDRWIKKFNKQARFLFFVNLPDERQLQRRKLILTLRCHAGLKQRIKLSLDLLKRGQIDPPKKRTISVDLSQSEWLHLENEKSAEFG
jgi:hypothetical protein